MTTTPRNETGRIPLVPATDAPLPCSVAPQLFHAAEGEHSNSTAAQERVRAARRLCNRCPIRRECGQHARTHRRAGVWGGETTGERKAVQRAATLAEAA